MLELTSIEKYYGERKILSLDRLTLYRGDKIAVVGTNGSGKTTLLQIISKEIAADSGSVSVRGDLGSIPQFHIEGNADVDARIAGKMRLDTGRVHSGGEQTKERIVQAFSQQYDILLTDEPTTNLDIESILVLERLLQSFRGALMLVSHDTALLKNVCNKVLEIDRGTCTIYNCSYIDYVNQKKLEEQAHQAQYDAYVAEKKRLKQAALEKAKKSARIKRAPKRMGNSEARLHKMGGQRQKAKLDSAAKSANTRMEKLKKVSKPWQQKPIVFDVQPSAVHSDVLLRVSDVSKSYGDNTVLAHCSFIVPNHKKTALLGANGSGKTTLLNMIVSMDEGIKACKGLKIGYFRQDINNLVETESILENAMADAIYGQTFVRTILARLLFRREEMDKKAAVLSGGERIKLSLAKIILSDFNLLVLDEPTNFLDITSTGALQDMLCAYTGAVFFVSHDREFISNVADRIVYIEGKSTRSCEHKTEMFVRRG